MQKLQNHFVSAELMRKYGIEIPNQILAKGLKDVISFCHTNGFPVFLKIDSPEISHKTDLGLVARANNLQEATSHFTRILEEATKITKNVNGVLVQEFIEGVEFIIGIKNDSVFGKVIMFGTGGIYTEIFKDVSFRKCPIDEKEALRMIKDTRAYEIMHARGKSIDENRIAKILSSVSQMSIKENIEGLDINPLLVGKKYVAIDVKIIK